MPKKGVFYCDNLKESSEVEFLRFSGRAFYSFGAVVENALPHRFLDYGGAVPVIRLLRGAVF